MSNPFLLTQGRDLGHVTSRTIPTRDNIVHRIDATQQLTQHPDEAQEELIRRGGGGEEGNANAFIGEQMLQQERRRQRRRRQDNYDANADDAAADAVAVSAPCDLYRLAGTSHPVSN